VYALGDVVQLHDGDARKLTVVLRMKSGDAVHVFDSGGNGYDAVLATSELPVCARLARALDAPPASTLEMTLAQAIPKGQKMDFIVEKATELGVARIVPLVTERTIAGDARAAKLERWQRLARTAAQQCGRRHVPAIESPQAWDDFCARAGEFERTFVPWELAERRPLRERLPELLGERKNISIAIGPEGGFSHAEIEQAEAAGATTISLGHRILRTETAGLVACSLFLYAAGDL
jgi:16S rRNA (uracil1498-N3)-methyltransferase